MSDILLPNKLLIPHARPDLVARSRLIKQLNQGLYRTLTLISAPAGFGKTTLVVEWVDSLRLNKQDSGDPYVAWLSLDEGDKDPRRFLAYLIAALKGLKGIASTFGDEALLVAGTISVQK